MGEQGAGEEEAAANDERDDAATNTESGASASNGRAEPVAAP